MKALEIMQEETWRIDQLWRNTRKMHEGFKRIGFQIGETQTPIVPILIGSEAKAFVFTQRLFEEGLCHARDLSSRPLWRSDRPHQLHGHPYGQ